jgi:hypothetical protein
MTTGFWAAHDQCGAVVATITNALILPPRIWRVCRDVVANFAGFWYLLQQDLDPDDGNVDHVASDLLFRHQQLAHQQGRSPALHVVNKTAFCGVAVLCAPCWWQPAAAVPALCRHWCKLMRPARTWQTAA